MKFIIFLIFSLSSLLANAPTSKKIATNTSSLKSSQQLEKKINQKLEDIAKEISLYKNSLDKTVAQIKNLKEQIFNMEADVNAANTKIDGLTQKNFSLEKNKKELEKKIIRIISEDFAFDLTKSKGYIDSIDSIMVDEVLDKMSIVIKDDFEKMAKEYTQTGGLINKYKSEINSINMSLRTYKQKQAKLTELQKKQEKTINSLNDSHKTYVSKIEQIQKEQNEIRKTLESLKVLQKKEIKQTQQTQVKQENKNVTKPDVRMIGSSYQKSKVAKYRGAKTIAPLENFTVKQKFGNYVDPLYNIKIFNESVVLSSKTPDAKVKNVLDGKIIFAKGTSMLKRVVIIENSNGIHTIYAHLNKIAPTIEVGKKIKKGFVIGRVDRDLTFEVTQKNYHIDPLELIVRK